jgi:hypothetical protein
MDYISILKYKDTSAYITLANRFWYRAYITSVTETSVEFIEEKGRHLTVSPEAIITIEPIQNQTRRGIK